MKYIQLTICLSDELGVKSVVVDYNDTELKSDTALIKEISLALLKSVSYNKQSLLVQDLLNELDIAVKKDENQT